MRLALIFFLLIFSQIGKGQGFCSHSSGLAFVESSVSPAYNALQNCYDVKFYDLQLEVTDTSTFIRANAGIIFQALSNIDTLVFELSGALTVDSVVFDESPGLDFIQKDGIIFIFPGTSIEAGSIHRSRIFYQGGQSDGGFFSGLTNRKDNTYQKRVTYTLSEPFQASSWFPVKQNLEDKADSVRVRIITPEGLLAGSNGLLTRKDSLMDGRVQFTWESKYPIAFYLISFAVSEYLDYSFYVHFDDSGDSLLIQNFIYTHPEIFTKEKDRIDKTADMIRFFSTIYGRYPFFSEKYGHAMAPMGGGMEHQTMTTLQNFNFDLVSHELAHQWFGDNVTCGTWQDIWVNEGFASYSEYLAREAIMGLPEAIEWMDNAHAYALREPGGSIYLTSEEAKNTSRIFSYSLSYKKGAAILHMLRNEMNNDELFFDIFREYQSRFKNSVAIADDFRNVVNDLSGEDYTWFFDQWYYGKGYPNIQAVWKQRADSLYIETFQESSSDDPEIFRMHLDFWIGFEDGSDSIYRVRIDNSSSKFAFKVSKKIREVQIDPYSKNLMNASIYEYFPEDALVEVWPVPFIDTLNLQFREVAAEKLIYVTNIQGKVVYKKKIGSVSSVVLNLSHLEPGVYFLVIEHDGEKNALRILGI